MGVARGLAMVALPRSPCQDDGPAPSLKNGGETAFRIPSLSGWDVHKATITVAIVIGERGGEVPHWGTIPNRADQVRKLAEKLRGDGRPLHFCYEAGRAAMACIALRSCSHAGTASLDGS